MLPIVQYAICAAVGLAAAVPLSRTIQALLFEAPPFDIVTFAAVGVGLAAVAGFASYLPARRAARLDPIAVLRME